MQDEYSRPSGDQQPEAGGHGHQPASNTELMERAKLLAAAAQPTVGGKADSIDTARVVEAAEDLIEAVERFADDLLEPAGRYGKLDGSSGIGQYVDKPEDYLHKYHSSNSQPTEAVERESEDNAPVSGGPREEEKLEETGSGGGSGVGDYVNVAKVFFK